MEVSPVDELPDGIPAGPGPGFDRDDAGRFLPSAATREMALRGAHAAGAARKLRRLLGLRDVPDDHPYQPYHRLAREWRDDHMRSLAATVGNGEVGPGPASIVSTAALQLAASRWLADKAALEGDPKAILAASRLGDASRQNLIAAHELCAREAAARQSEQPNAFWMRGSGANGSEVADE